MSDLFPHGKYQLFADDDDVIGLTVAKTYPSGWPIIRVEPPIMDAFDEFDVGSFLAWCLSTPRLYEQWRAKQWLERGVYGGPS